MRKLAPLVVLVGLALAPAAASGQPRGGPVVIDVTNPGREPYRIAVPEPVDSDAAGARTVAEVLSGDLQVSSFFRLVDPRSFLADLRAEGLGIDAGGWTGVGAQGVIKAKVVVAGDKVLARFRLYEVVRADRPVLERELAGPAGQLRHFAHQFAGEVVRYFTGEEGFFDSRIAFASELGRGVRELVVMDYDGAGARQVTHNGSLNILPAWSPDAARLAFTSFRRGTPDLYVTSAAGGRPTRVASFPGMNSGAAWSPDGSRIAATLSRDGDPDIYLLSPAGKILKQLTDDPAIDTSPEWSPDGTQLAFVSNRRGGAQIYVMPAAGGTPERVTFRGSYNQTPRWCPRRDVSLIAFTARDERNRFDLFTIDLKTKQVTRLTEERGDALDPTWAPTGRALAFVRGGAIWVMSADGHNQRAVWKGRGTNPTWSRVRPAAGATSTAVKP